MFAKPETGSLLFVEQLTPAYGLRAYNAYLYIQDQEGWWGDEMDAQEAMVALLYGEVGVTAYRWGGVWKFPTPVVEAATRKWNTYCSEGAWSTNCFNGFWGYYQAWMEIDRHVENLNNQEFSNLYYDTAERIISSPEVGVQTWTSPTGWVALHSTRQPEIYKKALSTGFYRLHFGNWLFIVLSKAALISSRIRCISSSKVIGKDRRIMFSALRYSSCQFQPPSYPSSL